MRIIYKISILNTVFCGLFFIYLILFNYFYADRWIPLNHIFAVLSVYLFYTILITTLLWNIWHSSLMQRVVSVLIYCLVTFTLYESVSFLIHDFLPKIGIQLFDDTQQFHKGKFQLRLIRGFGFINGSAILMVLIINLRIKWNESLNFKKQLKLQYAAYQRVVEEKKWSSHFLNNIFSISFGRKLIDAKPKKQTEILDIVQFLDYQLKAHAPLVSWEEELDQLHCFIRLINYQYGKDSVVLDDQSHNMIWPNIPHDSLLFALENCLKHGEFSQEDPVFYQLKNTLSGIQMICTNKISFTKLQDMNQRSGTGIDMLKSKMEQSAFPIHCQAAFKNGYFTLLIDFNFL